MKFLLLVLLTIYGSVAGNVHRKLIGGNAACGAARVRKSWDMLNAGERSLYVGAIESSIRNKILPEFAKVHMERMSEMQAHDTCGFVLWHRRFVLAFENMLRSQGPAFACVTVPYWDTMTQHKNMVDGKCRNMQQCSAIVTGLGGNPGAAATRTFHGRTILNACYGGRPYGSYCDDGNNCGCMPRNDVSATSMPPGNSFVSIFSMISSSKSYSEFTTRLQNGVHNEIHNAVGGFMSSFAAPVDALFFSWHGTIDMLMYAWHECHLANPLTAAQKRTSEYAFNQEQECRLNGRAQALEKMTSATSVYMRADGVDVRNHRVIGRYFRDVGTAYASWADARSMGDYSYSYATPPDFYRLLSDSDMCPAAAANTRPPVTTPPSVAPTTPPTIAPTTAPSNTPTTEPGTPTLAPSTTPGVSPTEEPTNTPTGDNGGSGVAVETPTTDTPTDTPSAENATESTELTYWEWYEQTRANLKLRFPDDNDEVNRQLEYMDCIGFDEKFGVQNFSDEFIEEFLEGNPIEPRCEEILKVIEKNQSIVVEIENEPAWGEKSNPTNNATSPPISPKVKERQNESEDDKHKSAAPRMRASESLIMAIVAAFIYALY